MFVWASKSQQVLPFVSNFPQSNTILIFIQIYLELRPDSQLCGPDFLKVKQMLISLLFDFVYQNSGNMFITDILSFFFFLCYLPSPTQDLHSLGLTIQIPMDQMPAEEQQIADQNTRQIHNDGLPQCVVCTMSEPPLESTHTNYTGPDPVQKLKFLIPPGIEAGSQKLYEPRHGGRHYGS